MSKFEQLQADISECKDLIAMAESLETLRRSTAFKKVIVEGYLKSEAVRNTMMLDQAHVRESAIRQLAGIASFNGFLETIEMTAEQAKFQLIELEAESMNLAKEV